MKIAKDTIDAGTAFDFGQTSADYARYRDIYPAQFYEKMVQRQLGIEGQTILDLGTGTGVLPQHMARFGGRWIGTDISENQMRYAKALSQAGGLDIAYQVTAAEDICFPDNTFDVVTACQCFWYFDYQKLTPTLSRILKPDGKLLLLYMAWLPFEDAIAGASEKLVLKYSPHWTGAGETKRPIAAPEELYTAFEPTYHEEYDVDIPFTRETWHGRMKACRGIGASLSLEDMNRWESEHKCLLREIAPPRFFVKHYIATLELRRK